MAAEKGKNPAARQRRHCCTYPKYPYNSGTRIFDVADCSVNQRAASTVNSGLYYITSSASGSADMFTVTAVTDVLQS
jgi:hypothetical protein